MVFTNCCFNIRQYRKIRLLTMHSALKASHLATTVLYYALYNVYNHVLKYVQHVCLTSLFSFKDKPLYYSWLNLKVNFTDFDISVPRIIKNSFLISHSIGLYTLFDEYFVLFTILVVVLNN